MRPSLRCIIRCNANRYSSITGSLKGRSKVAQHLLINQQGFDPTTASFARFRFQASSFATSSGSSDSNSNDVITNEPLQRRRFDEIPSLHPNTLKALQKKGLTSMTEIQERTFDMASEGRDVIGRARTGTGKTMGFLLPGLEQVLRKPIENQINMLVLSPTRELAIQTANEMKDLLSEHDDTVTSQVIYGGSSKGDDIKQFNQRVPKVLIATPGRLKDHLENTIVGDTQMQKLFEGLQVLVLDEMDRLLDLGFRKDIDEILSYLPKEKQTLLFSATMPSGMRGDLAAFVKSEHVVVDCIEDEDPTTHINEQISQSAVILPADRYLTGSLEIILGLIDNPRNKVIVFFPMTSLVELYTALISHRFGRQVFELHGKMQQQTRNLVSNRFRKSKNGTLLTTDVSARGVDYPDVTHVVQLGAAENRETYIHRLGRTGRASRQGHGMLLLPAVEKRFMTSLKGLQIDSDKALQKHMYCPPSRKLVNELGPIAQTVRKGDDKRLAKTASDVYHAMIGYYFQRSSGRYGRPDQIVKTINGLVRDIGMVELPSITLQRAQQMGIDHVEGLNILYDWSDKKRWTGSWVGEVGRQSGGFSVGIEQRNSEAQKYLTFSQKMDIKRVQNSKSWNQRMGLNDDDSNTKKAK